MEICLPEMNDMTLPDTELDALFEEDLVAPDFQSSRTSFKLTKVDLQTKHLSSPNSGSFRTPRTGQIRGVPIGVLSLPIPSKQLCLPLESGAEAQVSLKMPSTGVILSRTAGKTTCKYMQTNQKITNAATHLQQSMSTNVKPKVGLCPPDSTFLLKF